MLGSRLVKIVMLILFLVTTLACGCNLPNLNPYNRLAAFTRGNDLRDIFQGKTGDVRNDTAGIAFTVPEGFEAMFTSGGDTSIAPIGDLTFADPFITIMIRRYDGGTDYSYWQNNQYDILVYSQKADISFEADVTISGNSGKRYDYSARFYNPDGENKKMDFTCYKIILDLAPDRVMLIDAFWPTDRDDEIRPLFEQWLTTLELYPPLESK